MLTVLFFNLNCIEEIKSWYIFLVNKLKCLNHCHNIIKSSKKGSFILNNCWKYEKNSTKNEVSIMKLSARRGLECRILHHLSQSFCKGRQACSAWRRGPHQFACYLISLLKLHFFVLFFSYFFFYIFLIICITVYSLLFEKAVQWTLFTSLFALHHHSVFDKGAPV